MLPFKEVLQNHCTPNFPIEDALADSFGCTANDDWDAIIKAMAVFLEFETPNALLPNVHFDEIFNPQVIKVISRPDFLEKVNQYISVVDTLLQGSWLFSSHFDDTSAKEFGNTVAKTHLFDARHSILIHDGTVISSMEEWQALVDGEMNRIHQDETV